MATRISLVSKGSVKSTRTFKIGTKFFTGTDPNDYDNAYVLAIHNTESGPMAALVNLNTGASIRKLHKVASTEVVTAAELTKLNFKKSAPAIPVEA